MKERIFLLFFRKWFEAQIEVISKRWYKSKIIILQIIQSMSLYIQVNGSALIEQLNANLEQFRLYVPAGFFTALSIFCVVATIYYRMQPTVPLTIKKED